MNGTQLVLHDLGALPLLNARRFPDRAAYVGSEVLSWEQVELRAQAIAAVLKAGGVAPGDHVAILGPNDVGWLCVQFALWRLRAVPVLLHGGLPPQTLAHQVLQADVKAVIGGPSTTEQMSALRTGELRLFGWGAQPELDGVLLLDPLSVTSQEADLPITEVDPDAIAMLAYSSGTTGMPKGTIVRYRHVAARLLSVTAALELRSDDVGMILGPLFMGGTQNLSVIPYAAAGVTCILPAEKDPASVLRTIERWRVSTFFAVPTIFSALVEHGGGELDVSSLSRVLSAGAPLPQSLYREFTERFACGLYEVCGTFETGGGTAITERERRAGKELSVGRPMLGYLVDIHDDEGRSVSAAGVRGEMVYAGPSVAYEYYGSAAGVDVVTRHGFFRSGDVGYYDEDGYYYIVDRTKDVINSGGQNVYPTEIESVLLEIAGVRECAVIGLPHEKWGEAVHAVISVDETFELSTEEILRYVRERLAGFQVPKSVEIVDEIPKTAVGKVSKRDLRDRSTSPMTTAEEVGTDDI